METLGKRLEIQERLASRARDGDDEEGGKDSC